MHCSHTGTPFDELEPSGEPVNINGTAILRRRDGKILEPGVARTANAHSA